MADHAIVINIFFANRGRGDCMIIFFVVNVVFLKLDLFNLIIYLWVCVIVCVCGDSAVSPALLVPSSK